MSTFAARFASTCLACDERIHEGDPVKWVEGEVVHAECRFVEPEPVDVCRRCFMVPSVTGACGCAE